MEHHFPPIDSKTSRWVLGLLLLLVMGGLVFRYVAALDSLGIVHPDEHQQYLEQAQSLAFHGPAVRFEEQDRGMRNLFYPYALAAILRSEELLGLHNPFAQAAMLRFILAIPSLLLLAWFAWTFLGQGQQAAAITLVGMAALLPDMVFIGVRTLSESAMMLPLLVALLCMERRPFLAGVSLGLMFAIRFQSAFLIVGIMLVALFDDVRTGRLRFSEPWQSRTVRVGTGVLASVLLAVGLLDRVTLGGWFHSPIENFTSNILERGAAGFGGKPWFSYLVWAGKALLQTSVFAPVLLLLGVIKGWRLALVAAVMLVGHSVIAHKEFRFVWGVAPLMLLLIALGSQVVWEWLPARWPRVAFAVLLAASFIVGGVSRFPQLRWNSEPYRSSALALATVGGRSDLHGVAVFGPPVWECGNYFYLRRNVPLLFEEKLETLLAEPAIADGSINYLVASNREVHAFARWNPTAVAVFGDLEVCRLNASPGR